MAQPQFFTLRDANARQPPHHPNGHHPPPGPPQGIPGPARMGPPPPPPPLHTVPADIRGFGTGVGEIQDVSHEFVSDADMRDGLTEFSVYRFEKIPESRRFDDDGQLRLPTWDKAIKTAVGDMSHEQTAQFIRHLDRTTKHVVDKKKELPPVLQRQIDTTQQILMRNESDLTRFQWVLGQIDHKLREIKPTVVTTKPQSRGRSHQPRLGYRSSGNRHKKRTYERVSLTAYFKRVPRDGVDLRQLWLAKRGQYQTPQPTMWTQPPVPMQGPQVLPHAGGPHHHPPGPPGGGGPPRGPPGQPPHGPVGPQNIRHPHPNNPPGGHHVQQPNQRVNKQPGGHNAKDNHKHKNGGRKHHSPGSEYYSETDSVFSYDSSDSTCTSVPSRDSKGHGRNRKHRNRSPSKGPHKVVVHGGGLRHGLPHPPPPPLPVGRHAAEMEAARVRNAYLAGREDAHLAKHDAVRDRRLPPRIIHEPPARPYARARPIGMDVDTRRQLEFENGLSRLENLSLEDDDEDRMLRRTPYSRRGQEYHFDNGSIQGTILSGDPFVMSRSASYLGDGRGSPEYMRGRGDDRFFEPIDFEDRFNHSPRLRHANGRRPYQYY